MSRSLGFPVFDSDNHLYETRDAFTRHLPKQYEGAIEYAEIRGRTKLLIQGQVTNAVPNPTFDVVARPGAQEEYFRNGNPEGKSYREIVGKPMKSIPAFFQPEPRLKLLDELGVDRTMMYPTLASLLEERLRDDPELTHAVVHSLNQWLHEEWTFNHSDRIYTVPVITLPIVEEAIKELEWVVERGAKAVLIRPAPVPGFRGARSFALPEFDPFWKAVVDADILVTMHASDSGYSRYVSDWTGPGEALPFRDQAFRMLATNSGHKPVEDACSSMVLHGLFSRFPDLRVALIENGAGWVPAMFEHWEYVYKRTPQVFPEHPVEAFKRNIWIAPFHEDDIGAIAAELGADRLLFGSDYPHPEGLAQPVSYADHLPKDMSAEDVAKVMGGNLAEIMRVPVTA
ncbi:amidohydrolase family protein [Streptomyces sp. NPDC048251]|uniref:amidohydrolase family protein n=1 Tax=Streptomyces sp. NPDC048251 TaxID=3154501 RepID=UPI00343FFF0A